MNWPSHTDYQDAIQNPQVCFLEEELKTATVATDMLGMPRVMSGNFASVYELTTVNGKHYAIRCFVRQVANQQVRYNLLTRHLQAVTLPWLVGFEFQLRGIRLRNELYPIVKMDWVAGTPMHMYIEDHVQEPETLLRLAEQWRVMMKDLRANQIAHGDLQHGNVMCLPDGQFRLVDYDGMYVPAFGQGRSPELGHANYQHPRRTPDYYDINLDNFAALVIYTSFLALAGEPALWQQFHTGDNLIFLANDFKDPRNSKVFARLKKHVDPRVQKLAAVLERACIWPIAQVPTFESTLDALASGSLPEPAAQPAPVSAVPEWLAAVELPARPTGTRPSPPAPVPASRPAAAPAPPPAAAAAAKDYSAAGREAATQPLHTSVAVAPAPARAPVKMPEEAPPLNYFALAALAVAIVAIIPNLHWFGLLAVICGVIGWMQLQNYNSPLKWVALAGIVIGGAVFAIGLIKLLQRAPPPRPAAVRPVQPGAFGRWATGGGFVVAGRGTARPWWR
ncbi:MAG: hypothetical protein N3J91_03095 [Verrucomicrobiae bacterium]|nr:hypothetical protein [Verrucomicrobiae bacterium]